MREDEFVATVENIQKKRPIWFGLESDAVGSADDVTTAQTRLMLTFPPEYTAFVKRYGGGYFAFTIVYSVDRCSKWYVVQRNNEIRLIGRGFLAVSENGCGDYYGFRVKNGTARRSCTFSTTKHLNPDYSPGGEKRKNHRVRFRVFEGEIKTSLYTEESRDG